MRVLRFLLRAVVVALAGVALAGCGGGYSQALDVLNTFAPLTVAALLLCGAIGLIVERGGRARWGLALVILIGGAAGASRVLPELIRPIARAVPSPATEFKVLTANVWVDNVDPRATVAAIAASGADVVLLQEANGRVDEALDALAQTYPYRSRCWEARCGLVILSKLPLLKAKYRLRDADRQPYGPKLEWARLIAPDGLPVTVMTIHYPWPLPDEHQELVRADLAAALAGIDKRDLILTGDMNLTPWSFAMRAQDRALAPLVRQTRALASWPARLGNDVEVPLPLLPIDQIYAGPAWRHVAVTRLPRTGSDHYPVLAVFRRR